MECAFGKKTYILALDIQLYRLLCLAPLPNILVCPDWPARLSFLLGSLFAPFHVNLFDLVCNELLRSLGDPQEILSPPPTVGKLLRYFVAPGMGFSPPCVSSHYNTCLN